MQKIIEENIPLTTSSRETIGEIAATDWRKAGIFKKYGIDFCCGGKKTVKEVCTEKGIDAAILEQELGRVNSNPAFGVLSYSDWDLSFLADFIVNTHHNYVKTMLPGILSYALKVATAHGKKHPELLQIKQLVEEINSEMSAHMMEEEKVLFPYIKKLEAAAKNQLPVEAPSFGTVQNPINIMEMEHELVGKSLEKIRVLSDNYKLPGDACASYSLLYKMLMEFEDDLHLHIHLENNILFPKAFQLEASREG